MNIVLKHIKCSNGYNKFSMRGLPKYASGKYFKIEWHGDVVCLEQTELRTKRDNGVFTCRTYPTELGESTYIAVGTRKEMPPQGLYSFISGTRDGRIQLHGILAESREYIHKARTRRSKKSSWWKRILMWAGRKRTTQIK